MQKIFSVVLLVFCLSFAINFFHESKANAERVWAFSLGNVNFYVEIDHSYWFAAVVSNDGRGGYGYPTEFHFVDNMSGRLACEILYGNGTRDFVMLYESSMAQAVFNVLRNHPKFKNDIENALYNLQHPKEAEEKRRRQREQAQERAQREQQAKKAREEEENRRAEQEKINEFNKLIAEADKFYADKDYFSACGTYEAAGKIISTNKKRHPDGNVSVIYNYIGMYKIKEFFDNLVKNGDQLYSQQNYSAALDYYRKAMVMKPDQNSLLKKIQTIYENIGNNNYEDINFHKMLYMMNHSKISSEYIWDYYLQTKNFEEAVVFYDAYMITEKSNTDVLYKLCYSLNELGRYNEALKQLQKIDFKDTKCYFIHGKTYENLGNKKKAIEYYKKALKIDKNYTEAKEALAKISSKK